MSGGRLWNQYLTDIKSSFTEIPISKNPQDIFSETCIDKLPTLLKQHIINGKYLNNLLMDNMLIRFNNTKFRISAGKKPINIKFMQVNFAGRPDRHAFLRGKIFGIPMHAKDSVINGHGSMTVTLASLFQLFNVTGAEMDQSQLITALADAVYMPSLFLKNFVNYRILDKHTIECEITWNGISAKGQYTFDDSGNIIRFDTNDRYMDNNGKSSSRVPWYVTYSNYRDQNGFFQPGSVNVSWMLPDGDDTYFISDDIVIQYSIRDINVIFHQKIR